MLFNLFILRADLQKTLIDKKGHGLIFILVLYFYLLTNFYLIKL
jgi:hypothetical protein